MIGMVGETGWYSLIRGGDDFCHPGLDRNLNLDEPCLPGKERIPGGLADRARWGVMTRAAVAAAVDSGVVGTEPLEIAGQTRRRMDVGARNLAGDSHSARDWDEDGRLGKN